MSINDTTGETNLIHNTFLIRISTKKTLASTQYWPVDISSDTLEEFIATREELRSTNDDISEFPLIIHDYKFHARDLIADVLLVFVTDRDEDESSIFEKVEAAIKVLKKELSKSGIEAVIENYTRLIEPSVTTRLKIALVGEGGVGKTTTLHLLLGDTPPLQYVPTIALNLETVENIRFGNYSLVLWDFAGQERFRTLWRFYFHGADVIFLVCDSTLRNVIISKDILKLIKRDAPKVPVFSLANKQDKPNAMRPEVVQKILGIPTYPMVAIDKARRDEMLRILMNAAAQYVGVALPDLPASELLKFTDAATEEAIAETDALAEAKEAAAVAEAEYETVEIVEEVLVDEEGHIIEDMDEYEIVEEVIEQVEEDDLFVVEEDAEEEIPVESEELELPVIEVEESAEVIIPEVEFSNEHIIHTEIEEVETSVLDEYHETPVAYEETSESEHLEFELTPVFTDDVQELAEEIHVEIDDEEAVSIVSDFDDIFSSSVDTSGPEAVIEQNNDDMRMAKEIIFEALEADDIISAEIHRASNQEIDEALEAFGSDEVLPAEGEADAAEEIDAESLEELESILGPLDRTVGGTAESKEDDEAEHEKITLEIDNDSLKELSRLLDYVGSNQDEDDE
ncbi:GTP-binding protein [Candidatus Thorarchaeota archaeon]|nr:MAG: GTP-binding protein [Candidatus Thorarchaeota archaeon]